MQFPQPTSRRPAAQVDTGPPGHSILFRHWVTLYSRRSRSRTSAQYPATCVGGLFPPGHRRPFLHAAQPLPGIRKNPGLQKQSSSTVAREPTRSSPKVVWCGSGQRRHPASAPFSVIRGRWPTAHGQRLCPARPGARPAGQARQRVWPGGPATAEAERHWGRGESPGDHQLRNAVRRLHIGPASMVLAAACTKSGIRSCGTRRWQSRQTQTRGDAPPQGRNGCREPGRR